MGEIIKLLKTEKLYRFT